MSDADSSGGVRDCEEVNNDFDQVLQLIPPPYPAQPTAAERQRKGVEQLMFTKETNLMKLTTSCGAAESGQVPLDLPISVEHRLCAEFRPNQEPG